MSTPVYYLRADEDETHPERFELSIQRGPGLSGETLWSELLPMSREYMQARESFTNPGEEWIGEAQEMNALEAILFAGATFTDVMMLPDESGVMPIERMVAAIKKEEGIEQ